MGLEMAVSPRQVVRELKDAERTGYSHLVELYRERLTRHAIRLFGIRQVDAEELVNDVLLAVIHHIHSFEFRDSDGDFHLWVLAIFRNRIRDHARRDATQRRSVDRFFMEEPDAWRRDYSRNIPRHAFEYFEMVFDDGGVVHTGRDSHAMRLAIITDTLETLEPWERTLLWCRAADVPYGEIARYTGKPAGTLKVYHGRVRKRFAEQVLRRFSDINSQPDENKK
jgi:RNA polymerase sigma factor (sigma-70 family)